jgi:WD40 repeat protein
MFCYLPLSVLLLALTACGGGDTSAPKANGSAGDKPGSIGAPLYKFVVAEKAPPEGPRAAHADPIVIAECRLGPTNDGKEDVPSRYDGVLDSIDVKEGDYVKTGRLLAKLDCRQAAADLDSKKAKVVAAKKTEDTLYGEFKRDENVASKKALSEAELNVSRLRWQRAISDTLVAESDRQISQVALDLYELHGASPGIVRSIFKRKGESVKNLETVMQIYNVDRLRVEGLTPQHNLYYLDVGDKVTLEPAQPLRAYETLGAHLAEVNAVAVSNSPKNPMICSASDDKSVLVWDRLNDRRKAYLHPGPVRALACTPPGATANLCLSGGSDGKGRLFDLASDSDQPLRELKGQHRGPITAVAFSPDGSCCATGGEDRQIRIWDVATGDLRYTLPSAHRGAISSLNFTPSQAPSMDVHLISAGKGNNALCIWTLGTTGARLDRTIDRRSGDVTSLGVSSDGTRALFDQGRTLRILSLPSGLIEPHAVLQNPSGASNFTNFALFSPDGQLIVTAGAAEGRVQLWRAPARGQRASEIRQLQGAERITPNCATFSPDGKFIVVGTRDRQVLIWLVPDKAELDRQFAAQLTVVERIIDTTADQVRVCAEFENPRDADGRHLLLPGGTATMVIYPRK